MAQSFLSGTKAVRPGVYYRRERAGVVLEGSINGVLAVMYKSNWGALNAVVDFDQTMLNEVEDYAGEGADIIREGLLGGATTVRAVRIGTDGTPAQVTLKNTSETPVDALTLTARYVGNRAFTVSVRTNLITDKREIVIYDGTEIFASFAFEAGEDEAQAAVEAMANNRFFKATKLTGGALKDVTQVAMTGGTNPTTTTASYDKGTNVLERYRWNCLVADSDAQEVKTILSNFVKQSYETGHLGMACLAGQSTQDLETRMQLAASYNDEKIVYVLNGWRSNDGTVYDGWRAAARIGGMIAGSETNTSLTHDVISNAFELIESFTNGEIIRAEEKGCLVLTLNDEDQIWIDNAINTLVTLNATLDEGWKKIRRTKCRFELMDRINRTHDKLVGNVNNDFNGRATIIAAAQGVINEMVGENKLFAGSYVEEDAAHPSEGDSVYLKLNILDIDSAEKIYSVYVFRWGSTFDVV